MQCNVMPFPNRKKIYNIRGVNLATRIMGTRKEDHAEQDEEGDQTTVTRPDGPFVPAASMPFIFVSLFGPQRCKRDLCSQEPIEVSQA